MNLVHHPYELGADAFSSFRSSDRLTRWSPRLEDFAIGAQEIPVEQGSAERDTGRRSSEDLVGPAAGQTRSSGARLMGE